MSSPGGIAAGSAGMQAIVLRRTGGPEVLALETLPLPEPAPGEVLIEVAAAALNHADLMQRGGRYTKAVALPTIPGLEVAGTVRAVRGDCGAWRVGDRICTITAGGGYAGAVAVPASRLLPVPDGIDMIGAASLPEAAFTVWSNLIGAGRMTGSDTVLIHGGAGGIGSFAIQAAAGMGARVLTTCGSEAKAELCRKLGAVRAIDYRSEAFDRAVLEETGGRGADVILDMMGAPWLTPNLAALAPDGRIAMIGMQGGADAAFSLVDMFRKRGSLFTTSLRDRTETDKSAIAEGIRRDFWPLLARGRIRPVIDRIFDLNEARAAHEYMETGAHAGKIVLRVTHEG